MPSVGGKKFPYTKKGEAKAKSYAKKTGKKMTIKRGRGSDFDGDGYKD